MRREDIDASITEILVDRHGVKNNALRLQLVRLFEQMLEDALKADRVDIKQKIEKLDKNL